jgi:serralysin
MSLRLWGSERIVNTTTLDNQYLPVVAGLTGGGYVIAWIDTAGGTSRLFFQRYDALGVKSGPETLVPYDGDGNQTNPQILAMPEGGFVIGYIDEDLGIGDGDDARTALFSENGTLVNQSELSAMSFDFTANSLTARGTGFMQSKTYKLAAIEGTESATFLANGNFNFAGIVEDKGGHDEFNADLATNATTGKIIAVYVDRDTANITESIKLEFSNSVFNETFIDTPIDVSGVLSGSNVSLFNPHVTWVGANRIAVSWEDTLFSNLFYRLFDAAGVAVTPVTEIVSTNSFSHSRIVDLKNGTFAIVYDTSGDEIMIRVFDSNGTQIGAELIVNTNGQSNLNPEFAALADGRLVVTWNEFGAPGDGSGTSVMQQILDPRDGIVNGSNNAAITETLTGHDALGDVMRGYAGNDIMYGLAGGDVMYGGDGADYLYGGRGDDTLFGGNDVDILFGGY